MKKIHVTLNVAEDSLLQESGQTNLTEAISQELGWLHDSGMFVETWSFDAEKNHEHQLIDNLLNYLGDHFDSSKLYQMLHDDLEMTHEDIGILGFDLPQCHEESEIASVDNSDLNTQKTVLSPNLDSNVKAWYLGSYPSDELGHQIRRDVTFRDVVSELNSNSDIYHLLGDGIDSIVRERIFAQTSEILGVDYNVIYNKWLNEDMVPDIIVTEKTEKINWINEDALKELEVSCPDKGKEIAYYLHGNCDEWVLENFQDGDIAVIWNEFDISIGKITLIHCYIQRGDVFLDVRGETADENLIKDGFDYGYIHDKIYCSSLEEYKSWIRNICGYKDKKWAKDSMETKLARCSVEQSDKKLLIDDLIQSASIRTNQTHSIKDTKTVQFDLEH